jgi:oxygen-dependent protoporphyrinogen oxidase
VSNRTDHRTQRVAVIGGGFSGMAAAHRLTELAPEMSVSLFEASDRLGGVVRTVYQDGYVIEGASDMFTTKEPWAVDLCRRIGFLDQLIETNEGQRRAFVVHRGRLQPVPDGFTLMTPVKVWPVVTTPLLSLWGKARLACELFVPRRRDPADESLADFTRRRMGNETYERLVQPLISSIYTADPTKLSMQAALPQFFAMERKYGSLTWGMRRVARAKQPEAEGTGARYSLFVSARDGLGTFVDALASRLPPGCTRLQSAVRQLRKTSTGQWELVTDPPSPPETFDAVIIATPAHRTAELLQPLDQQLAEEVGGVHLSGVAIVVLGYQRSQIRHPLDGFGCVIPIVEHRRVLSVSFSSVKFAGRAPAGCVQLRVFVGGACQPELADLPDHTLRHMVAEELQELLGINGDPQLCEIFRWPATMPQYHVGHLDRVARIEQRAATLPKLALAGNAYRGVGIPFCIRSGENAAQKILQQLAPHKAANSAPHTPPPQG